MTKEPTARQSWTIWTDSGNMSIKHHHQNGPRSRTGAAVLVVLGLDVVFFAYGMTSGCERQYALTR